MTLWRATGCKSNPTASTVTFTDVHNGDWYAPAIQALSAAGVFSGSSDGKFNPTGTITEAQLTGLMNKVASVSFAGFANGVTRLEMVMEAYEKYKDSPLAENLSGSFSSSFTDIGTCSSREQTAIAFFEELGIVQGFNETLPPSTPMPLRPICRPLPFFRDARPCLRQMRRRTCRACGRKTAF